MIRRLLRRPAALRWRPPGPPRSIVGLNARDSSLVRPLNPRRGRVTVDDKIITKEILARAGVPTPKTHFIVESFADVAVHAGRLQELDDFVIKPSRGKGGEGILVVVGKNDEGWVSASGQVWTQGEVNRRFGNIVFGEYARRMSDRAIVEERLEAETLLSGDFPMGLPDVRVITVHQQPVMAMVRVPTQRSGGRANLHQGAIGVGVDLTTGKTTHATYRGREIREHPDSGAPVVDVRLDRWDAILDVALRSARALPLGYLGVDVALTRDGEPVVLEANARPGLEIQNANRRGLGPLIRAVEEMPVRADA